MWEKDKKLIKMYRDCMNQVLDDVKNGEEVDFETACLVESEKIQSYCFSQMEYY